ncbi:MAG TPA: hypothetical protein VG165_17880 [Solirubrobacteraceae bacterium]|jgi:hypothetical protein|nr:hypothetical protein [Solirubrobacteraceae bacterium]
MRRDHARGEAGSLLAGGGGVLLLISLFLDWYVLPGFTITAWTAFEVWDVVLAVIALAVVLGVATDLGWWRGPAHAIGITLLGGAALLIVASQLIDRPPAALHSAIGTGGWLGLVGAGAIVVGALAAESRVTVSIARAAPDAAAVAADPRPGAAWTPGRRRSRAAAQDSPVVPGGQDSRVVPGGPVAPDARGAPGGPIAPSARVVPGGPVMTDARVAPGAPIAPDARVVPGGPIVPPGAPATGPAVPRSTADAETVVAPVPPPTRPRP